METSISDVIVAIFVLALLALAAFVSIAVWLRKRKFREDKQAFTAIHGESSVRTFEKMNEFSEEFNSQKRKP